MRLKEFEQREAEYLIVNGWHSTRVRSSTYWNKGDVKQKEQDDAVAMQKAADREISRAVSGKRLT